MAGNEVGGAVIRPVAVDVMDDGSAAQWLSHRPLNDQEVLRNVPVLVRPMVLWHFPE
jgi:hypothetical protein